MLPQDCSWLSGEMPFQFQNWDKVEKTRSTYPRDDKCRLVKLKKIKLRCRWESYLSRHFKYDSMINLKVCVRAEV